MHLIAPLAAGVNGAENGTVTIYQRGTSSRAATYSDFYGASANSVTADLTLDANGGRAVYVNQLVDCTVKDSDGATVRTFTAGDETTAIQYSGTAFTGTDPVTGVTAINKPSVLKGILDLFRTSFGATNANVSFGGSSRLLHEVLAGLDCFYNVKDPLYGAEGDGTTDDTAAIQAAMDAAEGDGGGIVFFPAGTYKTSDVLTLADGVSLMGAGAQAVRIAHTGGGDGNKFVITVDVTYEDGRLPVVISGFRFEASDVHEDAVINVAGGDVIIRECLFGESNEQGTLIKTNGAVDDGYITLENCGFIIKAASQEGLNFNGTMQIDIRGCKFHVYATSYTADMVALGDGVSSITDCVFNASAATAGTIVCIDAGDNGAGTARVRNCHFVGGGGATAYAMDAAAATLYESDNTISGSGMSLYGTGLDGALTRGVVSSRERRGTTASCPTTTAVAVNALEYGFVYVTTSGGAGVRSIELAYAPPGSRMYVFVTNAGSGTHTFTVMGEGSATQAANAKSVIVGSVAAFTLTTISTGVWVCTGEVTPWP